MNAITSSASAKPSGWDRSCSQRIDSTTLNAVHSSATVRTSANFARTGT